MLQKLHTTTTTTTTTWDINTGTDAWYSEIKFIMNYANIDMMQDLNATVCLDLVKANLLKQCRNRWAIEALSKPKLRTFVKIHDTSDQWVIIQANLSRRHRSLVTKFKAGVLSLKVETGRFKGNKPALKICDICTTGEIEDEMHHLYCCEGLSETREKFINHAKTLMDNFDTMTEEERTKFLLQKEHVKFFGHWLDTMYSSRFEKMNQKI